MIEKGVNIDSTDRTGRTALHLASSEGHTLVVCILIRNGANPNIRDNLGNEPLCEAIIKGHTKTSDELVLGGARLSETAQAALDMKFRHLAAAGDLGGIKMLAETGLAIDAVDSVGRSALHIAAERGHEHVVEYLLARGADVRRRDQAGDTALSLASRHNLSSIQEALLSRGASWRDGARMPRSGSCGASFALMEACPRPIAAATLSGHEAPAIARGMASLFFSDVVGFTTISSTLSASKVSRMLDRLFKQMDRLAYLHGVQKVDVVGDAYIAATNFTEDQPDDHAARLARFAIDAAAAAEAVPIDEDDPAGLGCLRVRVGLHCGPVSAIVAERAALKYTLIGETARIASNMESTGAAGRVHCSAPAARLIAHQAHDLVLRPRTPSTAPAPESGDVGGSSGAGGGAGGTFWVSSLRRGWRSYRSCPDLLASAGLGGGGSEQDAPRCSWSPLRETRGAGAGVGGGWNGLRLDALDCLGGVRTWGGLAGSGSGRCAYAHADGLVRGTLLLLRMHTQIFRL